jgi:hypothetical protein
MVKLIVIASILSAPVAAIAGDLDPQQVVCSETVFDPANPWAEPTLVVHDVQMTYAADVLGNVTGHVTFDDAKGNLVAFNHSRRQGSFGGFSGLLVDVYENGDLTAKIVGLRLEGLQRFGLTYRTAEGTTPLSCTFPGS